VSRRDDQDRWPKGTPVGPGGKGPGGGRFRDAGPSAPGVGGDWADRISSSIGGDADNEALLDWETKASEYMRSVESMRDDEINDFWEWVALTGGGGPDDGDPEDWAARVLSEFYEDRDDGNEDGISPGEAAYDPRTTSFVVGMTVNLPGGGRGRVTAVGSDGFVFVQPDGGGQVQVHTASFLRSLRDG